MWTTEIFLWKLWWTSRLHEFLDQLSDCQLLSNYCSPGKCFNFLFIDHSSFTLIYYFIFYIRSSYSYTYSVEVFIFLWIYTQSVGLVGQVIVPSQGLYLNTGHHKHRKTHTTSMSEFGSEPTITASEQTKTVHALDRATTVTGAHAFTVFLFCLKYTIFAFKELDAFIYQHILNVEFQFNSEALLQFWILISC
jgi:hypothetical protein